MILRRGWASQPFVHVLETMSGFRRSIFQNRHFGVEIHISTGYFRDKPMSVAIYGISCVICVIFYNYIIGCSCPIHLRKSLIAQNTAHDLVGGGSRQGIDNDDIMNPKQRIEMFPYR